MDNFELAKKYFFEGVDYLERGLFQEAEDKFLESLRIVPDRPSTLTNLAAAQIKLKKYSGAKQCSERSMELEKNNPETFMNLGLISKEESEYDLALDFFNRAILLNPDQSLAWLNKGATLNQLKRYDEALVSHEKSLAINPGCAEAWANHGITLHELERYDEALASYEKALSLDGNNHEVWSNQGITLHELKRYDDALASYEKAIEINPEYAEAWSNRGFTFNQIGLFQEALTLYEKSIAIKPDHNNAIFNLGLVQLLTGDLMNGWRNHEKRWLRDGAESYRHKKITPLTSLNELAQKRVLVWCEQGYGDTIQFARYIKILINLGAQVIFEVQPLLKDLIQQSFLDCEVIATGNAFHQVDFQVPLLSLPLLFNTEITSIPSDVPYLTSVGSKNIHLKSHLNLEGKKINIGIAFSGNPSHKNDFNRSMDLPLLKPLLKVGNLFVIQKGITEKDQLFLNAHPEIQYLGDQIHSFADTATCVKQMDIIVSVDTSMAHLAGALGLPTYTLLPWVPDWRWLLNREDSPWYPTMEVLRQPCKNDWQSVVENLTTRIASKYFRC
ncbi:MAG: tetratricopeptide repeat protein [Polynucleobacter sp.]